MIGIDEDGATELVLEDVDARLQEALVLAGCVVLGVFAQVPEVAEIKVPMGKLRFKILDISLPEA